jgi:hypothetical protein
MLHQAGLEAKSPALRSFAVWIAIAIKARGRTATTRPNVLQVSDLNKNLLTNALLRG